MFDIQSDDLNMNRRCGILARRDEGIVLDVFASTYVVVVDFEGQRRVPSFFPAGESFFPLTGVPCRLPR